MIETDTTDTLQRAGLRGLLVREHERLDRLFDELLSALQGDARADVARLWSEFDESLTRHMAFEEQRLLPAFEAVDPREAAALVAEHAQIRRKLLDLGIGVDLHLTRADVVNEFVELLRRHAQREDELLYRWAEKELPEAAPTAHGSSAGS
jgi:hemerythrin-like domain-containing protein